MSPTAPMPDALTERTQKLIAETRALAGSAWAGNKALALYEEADALAELAQQAGRNDLGESLLGLAAYLSAFGDSAMVPNAVHLSQLRALADAVADAEQRHRAKVEAVPLAPDARSLPAAPPVVYYGRSAPPEGLQKRMNAVGYHLVPATSPERALALLGEGALALILDADVLDDWLELPRRVEASARVPLVVTAASDSIEFRLKAMRCSAEAFFVLPEDVDRIAPRLAGLLADRVEPYRVLIVDDDQSMRVFCESVLRHNGMQTRAVGAPEEALLALGDFSPEVILADLYMPDLSGFELLALFRAHPRTAFTPVVLLSGDEDAEKRFDALHIGGDDFLTKPIRPRYLVAAVLSRARRARAIRREMMAAR